MTPALLFLATTLAFAATKPCEPELRVIIEEARGQGSAELHLAEIELATAFNELYVWRGRGSEGRVTPEILDQLTTDYSVAVGLHVRGIDQLAVESVRRLARRLREAGVKCSFPHLKEQIRSIAARPTIERPFAEGGLGLKGQDSPVDLFSRLGFAADPRHAELVLLLSQFGHLQPRERALVMGPGAPAVAKVSHHYAPRTSFVGFNVDGMKDEHLEGLRFADGYKVVAALDVFTSNPEVDSNFKARPLALARAIRNLLAPSGLLLILNDHAAPPPFSRAELEKAGFTIVRWGLERTLPPEAIAEVGYAAGELRAYVLRYGPEPRADAVSAFVRQAQPRE